MFDCCCCKRGSRSIPITNDAIPIPTKTPGTFIQREPIDVVSAQPVRPNNFGNGRVLTHDSSNVGRDWTPDTPNNTPIVPQKPEIIVSSPENQIVKSQIVTDSKVGTSNSTINVQPSTILEHESESNVESKPEAGKFSSTQTVVDSASNAGFSTPIGEKMETTITSSSSKMENYDDNKGNISSKTTVVTSTESSKSEFHSVMSSTKNFTLSSSSEEPIGEIVSQIVNDSFNKNAAAISEAKKSTVVTSVITSNDDKKRDEKQIETVQSEAFPPVYVAICPPKPLATQLTDCPAKPPTDEPELKKPQEENKNDEGERPASTYEAFKNFVGGLMTSAVNAVSPQSETTEPKFNEESKIDCTVTVCDDSITQLESSIALFESKLDKSAKPKEENEIVTTEIVTNSSGDIGFSSPGLVNEIISSKVEIVPSTSKDENELISSSVTKESSAFVELPNGFHKEETTSTVQVISSHPKSEFITDSRIVSSQVSSNSPIIVKEFSSAYNSMADEPTTSEFKDAYEDSHNVSSSLETTTSSIYYEASSTSYESTTEHFSSSHKVISSSNDHIGTHDSSTNDTHDYSSFDVD